MARLTGILLALALPLVGCAALRDDMDRAERSYDDARYDDALVWLEALEEDTPDMDLDMRARFYFLRGMTAYRLGQRDDALHYLAVAREIAGAGRSAALRPEQAQTMERALDELTPQDASFHARARAGTSGGETPREGAGGGAADGG